MRTGAVALGLAAWSVGIGIPAAYTAAVTDALLHESGAHTNYTLDYMIAHCFNSMPGLMWVYLIAMLLVGAILVLWGLTVRPRPLDDLGI